MPEDRYTVSGSFRESITARGFEVNVHDLTHDGRLYADHAEFLRRAQRINSYVREYGAQGFRWGFCTVMPNGFAPSTSPTTCPSPMWRTWIDGAGWVCTVMPFFLGSIIELPVTCIQDYTLFHILNDYTLNLWKRQIALVRERHGLISFIVHPDYIIERRPQDTYRALLTYLAELREENDIWTALPRDVATWWRQRSRMNLVDNDGVWSVEGPGSERARIAYASLAGDTVEYSLDV